MIIVGKELSLIIYDSNSLKDKRSVIKSMIHKMKNKYNISISEVDAQEMINQSIIGVVTCSDNHRLCHQILDRVVRDIESLYNIEIHNIVTYEI